MRDSERMGGYLEHQITQEETVEATLAFILLDLEDLAKSGCFTMSQEDQLQAIEFKIRELRTTLS